jgi:hypothetical protein
MHPSTLRVLGTAGLTLANIVLDSESGRRSRGAIFIIARSYTRYRDNHACLLAFDRSDK